MGKIPYCGKEERKPYNYTWWTPERVAEARQLKAEGLTNSEVADEMNVTRGSLIAALARYPSDQHNMVKRVLTAPLETARL